MATITDTEIPPGSYDAHNKRLRKMRIQIDGIDYFKTARNVQSADGAAHAVILANIAESLRLNIETNEADKETQAIKEGSRDWHLLPETTQKERDDKQRIAQTAIREAAQCAVDAWRLSQRGKNRPKAAEKYMEARQLANKIFSNLADVAGPTITEQRNYLALTAAEWAQAGGIKRFHNELPGPWDDVVTWMTSTVTEVKPIRSEMTV